MLALVDRHLEVAIIAVCLVAVVAIVALMAMFPYRLGPGDVRYCTGTGVGISGDGKPVVVFVTVPCGTYGPETAP